MVNPNIFRILDNMSKTKQYIEAEMQKGNDVLHPETKHLDDEYEYETWCHYSGMPSPKAYESPEKVWVYGIRKEKTKDE